MSKKKQRFEYYEEKLISKSMEFITLWQAFLVAIWFDFNEKKIQKYLRLLKIGHTPTIAFKLVSNRKLVFTIDELIEFRRVQRKK